MAGMGNGVKEGAVKGLDASSLSQPQSVELFVRVVHLLCGGAGAWTKHPH